MADDSKRINCVKVCFSDRLFIDIGRYAALEDRSPAELIHLIVRRHMYGNFARGPVDVEGTDRDREGL